MGRSVGGLISKFYVGHKGLSGLCMGGTMKQKMFYGAGVSSTLAHGAVGRGETHLRGMFREHGVSTS